MSTSLWKSGSPVEKFPAASRGKRIQVWTHWRGSEAEFPFTRSPPAPALREVLPGHLKGLQQKYNETDVDFFQEKKRKNKRNLPDADRELDYQVDAKHCKCLGLYICNYMCIWINICIYVYATATAKSLQSCRTLCDPIDGSPPGSPVPGILQARTLEWVAISFSNA